MDDYPLFILNSNIFQNIFGGLYCHGWSVWIFQCHKNEIPSDIYLTDALASVHSHGYFSLSEAEQWENLPSKIIYS